MDAFEFIRQLGADVKLTVIFLFGVFGVAVIAWDTFKRRLMGFVRSFILVAVATAGLGKIGLFTGIAGETFDRYDGAPPVLPTGTVQVVQVVPAAQLVGMD